jgi:type VI secretion system secreted protein VgrG
MSTQDGKQLEIVTPLGKDVLLLEGFRGTEELGRLFRFELDLLSEEESIDPRGIVGKQVTFRVNHEDDTPRWFTGYVSRFSWRGSGARLSRWSAEVVPGLWFLTRTSDCRIWQQQVVPDILDAIFADHGDWLTVRTNLQSSHPELEYCVQYRETDFSFISRLMEKEGIVYFFRHDRDTLETILTDNSSDWMECRDGQIEGVSSFADTGRTGLLSSWSHDWNFRSGRHSERDYNFETPTADLLVTSKGRGGFDGADKLELFEYPGEYADKDDGGIAARRRMEEEEVSTEETHGGGMCRSFSPGGVFTYSGQRYLLTKVTHTAKLPAGAYETDGTATGGFEYTNTFSCIPAETPFRSARTTPKPVIAGAQPAIVVGPADEEIHPDEYGRVKVQFYWDRYGQNDDKSSCWIRVAQSHAGPKWGSMDLPRIGEEVIVGFYEGDPDRPIITGRVYNGLNKPPFDLPTQKTRTGIRSKTHKGEGYNEISVDDTDDGEQIRIHGEKNMSTEVGNNLTEHVKVDRNRTVDNDETVKIANNKSLDVGVNKKVSVGADHTETVGANQAVTVGSNQTTSVGANQTNTVASSQSNSVGMTKTESVGVMSNENVGMMKTTNVGVAYSIISGAVMNTAVGFVSAEEVGMTKKIIVGSKLEVVVGASKLTMDAGGKVTIEGTEFLFSAKGNVKINGSIIDLN